MACVVDHDVEIFAHETVIVVYFDLLIKNEATFGPKSSTEYSILGGLINSFHSLSQPSEILSMMLAGSIFKLNSIIPNS